MHDCEAAEEICGFTGKYGFLSNFHLSPVTVGDGIVYPSGEHAFQAQKTPDRGDRQRIAKLASPGEAKGAGRHVPLRADWERVKKQVMLRVVLGKFCRNEELADLLRETGRARLTEGNTWHDNYWGDCRCGRPSCSGRGFNYLGEVLMAVRMILRVDAR